jgi:hypothetical protein
LKNECQPNKLKSFAFQLKKLLRA